MARRKAAKGKVVARTGVKRKKGYFYFVDGKGDVRETKMKRGGKKGRRVCKPAKRKTTVKTRKRKATRRKTSRR